MKIGMKIATPLSTNVSAYAPHAKLIFLAGKNMAALSALISQMVAYLLTGSHVKPQRGMTEKNIKTTNVITRGLFCFCVGQELI